MKRSPSYRVQLSIGEYRRVAKRAEACGERPAAFVRRLLLAGVVPSRAAADESPRPKEIGLSLTPIEAIDVGSHLARLGRPSISAALRDVALHGELP